MTRNIFVPLIGQYDNIGDIYLRRQLLAWLRGSGKIHAYVGEAPDGFPECLGLTDDDHLYRSVRDWSKAILRNDSPNSSYVFKPGEIQLSAVGMKEHVGMLPMVAAVKRRGGSVLRIGVGARSFDGPWRLAVMPSIKLSDVSLWRDLDTRGAFKNGSVMPDLAFGEGMQTGELTAQPRRGNGHLTLSLRGDRPLPPHFVDGVTALANETGLKPIMVVQVRRDRDRSLEIARALKCDVLDWTVETYSEQERRLRAVFRESDLVLSDRLHVVIGALTEGAPSAGIFDQVGKIRRHLVAAGHSSDYSASTPDAGSLVEMGHRALANSELLVERTVSAKRNLELIRAKVRERYLA